MSIDIEITGWIAESALIIIPTVLTLLLRKKPKP